MYSLIPQVKTKISFFSLLAFVTSTDNDDRQGAPHRLSFVLHGTLEKKRGDPGGDLVKRAHIFTLLFIFMLLSGRLWAGTFFLYIEESCNGERGLFMTGTREGILDTFFENNQDRMDYRRFRLRGWPIGSGPVEAAAKTLVKMRMCRSGMRWSRKGGQRILDLRTYVKSNRWDAFWNEYKRLLLTA